MNFLLRLVTLSAITTTSALAQVQLYPIAEAVIRDGSNSETNLDESVLGYLMVKYGSGSSGKAYFKFDFAGQKPNTNSSLTLNFTTAKNSQRQHAQVWALNQPYPGFTNSTLVWSTAQANETNTSSLLTNSANPFTATPLVDFVSPGTAGALARIVIPPPWGRFLFANQLVLALTSPWNDPTNQANGLRVLTNSAFLEFSELTGSPPVVSQFFTNVTVVAGQLSPELPFTVNDAEDAPDSLSISVNSSDENIVPSGTASVTGTGSDRRLSFTAGTTPGIATLYVNVTDLSGNTSQAALQVTVLPLNYAPTISVSGPVFTFTNVPASISFTVADAETAAQDLILAGEIADYSSAILTNLTFSGSGSNRIATVEPVTGADGVGVIRIHVSDPQENTNTIAIAVVVLPGTNVLFSEHFDYPDGALMASAANLWVRRNSQAQSLRLNVSGQQAYIRPKASTDDLAAPLAGGAYAPGSHAVLYTLFSATWTEQPDVTPAVTNSAGSFVQLLNNPTATSVALAEVGTGTNDVPEGAFQLGLIDSENILHPHPVNLAVPAGGTLTSARVVTRYDVDTGISTLWVDAASEAAPFVNATDTANPASVGYIGLRQDLGMGYIYLDDLKVVLANKPMLTRISAGESAGSLSLFFSAAPMDDSSGFQVERTYDLSTPFTEIPATIVPLGSGNFNVAVPALAEKSFFRVKRRAMQF